MSDQVGGIWSLYDLLCAEFPDVKHRSQGGTILDYITGEQCIDRLNHTLAPDNWDFRILDHGQSEPNAKGAVNVWALGELKVYFPDRTVIKQQFGECMTNPGMGEGDARKGAATDALKKCATLIGIALYLYDKTPVSASTAPVSATGGQLPRALTPMPTLGPLAHETKDAWSNFWVRCRALGWTPSEVTERLGGMDAGQYARTHKVGPDEVWLKLQPNQAG